MSCDKQLHYLCHSLGLRDDGSGRPFRNYFAADPGDETCATLVASGDMEFTGQADGNSGEACLKFYRVTEKGRARVISAFKDVAPLTTAQKNYQQFLDADSGMTFFEWMKARKL